MHFADGKNYGSHQFLNWWQQHATGMLHLDGFESHHPYQTKKPRPYGLGFGLAVLNLMYMFYQVLKTVETRKP